MEAYKSEARGVIKRFLANRLSFPDCIAALDAALAGLVPRLQGDELPELRAVMLSNNEIVMKEMEKRGPPVLDFPTLSESATVLGWVGAPNLDHPSDPESGD